MYIHVYLNICDFQAITIYRQKKHVMSLCYCNVGCRNDFPYEMSTGIPIYHKQSRFPEVFGR